MNTHARKRTLLTVAAAGLLLFVLATALARKFPASAPSGVDYMVVLNTRIKTYHCEACDVIRNCGSDCVTVNISEARRRGAKPCAVCGGICLARSTSPSITRASARP